MPKINTADYGECQTHHDRKRALGTWRDLLFASEAFMREVLGHLIL
jgi:hypothetical protein